MGTETQSLPNQEIYDFLTDRYDTLENTARFAHGDTPWLITTDKHHGTEIETDNINITAGPDYIWDCRDPHYCQSCDPRRAEARAAIKHIFYHQPRSVLADIASKRRLLQMHQHEIQALEGLPTRHEATKFCVECGHATPCPTLRILASPFRNHPDWKHEYAQHETPT